MPLTLSDDQIARVEQLCCCLDAIQWETRGARRSEAHISLMGIAGELRRMHGLDWHPRPKPDVWPEMSANAEPIPEGAMGP